MGEPSGLDCKHAECFNWATINDQFRQLGKVFDVKGDPWAMDGLCTSYAVPTWNWSLSLSVTNNSKSESSHDQQGFYWP